MLLKFLTKVYWIYFPIIRLLVLQISELHIGNVLPQQEQSRSCGPDTETVSLNLNRITEPSGCIQDLFPDV